MQKTLQDKELEGLQQKVQRLEKLCRALQIERNELSKKIQELGDGSSSPPETSGGDGGEEGPSEEQEPRDSEEGSPSPAHTEAPQPETEAADVPCPAACHCGPEPVAEVQREACALAAQD